MTSSLRDKISISIAGLLLLTAIYMIFLYVPTERVMGPIQKIFYFHLSCALGAFLSFVTAFVCGLLYLIKKDLKWDILGAASVEIGLVFTTLVLITGMLWGRPIWNTWWTWDPRLTTSLILWFIYASYFILRSSVERQEKRAVFCAVLAIVGFADVPIVFLSARLWRTIHPVVIRASSIDMAPEMIATLVMSLLAFTSIWVVLLSQRTKALTLAGKIRFLEKKLDGEGI